MFKAALSKNTSIFLPIIGDFLIYPDKWVMVKKISHRGYVRQEATSRIAAVPLLPFEVTLLWHTISVMRSCEALMTMWRTPEV